MRSLLVLCVVNLLVLPCSGYQRKCPALNGLSNNYNETVAHAVHSMTVEGLRLFIPTATADNPVPTVDSQLTDGSRKVRLQAPDNPLGSAFTTQSLNTIDKIMSDLGQPGDGLGKNWSPLERVVHSFHMWDLWVSILDVYRTLEPVPSSLCHCLLDTQHNGIEEAVQWVADHYQTGTPITLLNRPIPKLKDAQSWTVWKERLLYYYTPHALRDAALYLRCVSESLN